MYLNIISIFRDFLYGETTPLSKPKFVEHVQLTLMSANLLMYAQATVLG